MKKFKFTLQTVHNVREMRKERETVVLSELQAEASEAASRVSHLEKMRSDAIDNYTRRLTSGEQLNAMEMELNSNHFASLNRLQQEAEKVAAVKREACDRQIETVTAAVREVKITDRLRESQKTVHKNEYAREEQNGIDEMVISTFARKLAQTK